ncbi:hypothetical protein MM236_10385 [Belliella sp. DSM 107340]|uniref:Uncharacterized protein n=1 Tax=Belliella calami TaxID=2923436 RepID=A0ABS9UP47_9BACT|nr:hypothetical protein [Belliella calami]MCH7398399.1 hypothetical protein [Belliella calami]
MRGISTKHNVHRDEKQETRNDARLSAVASPRSLKHSGVACPAEFREGLFTLGKRHLRRLKTKEEQ